tara:strand:- start:2493 stop:2633 length:141 start_codon:yes stop_codon:yes gene_type:complete
VAKNGMANDDRRLGGRVNDQACIDYLNGHVAAAKEATEAGVPLKAS